MFIAPLSMLEYVLAQMASAVIKAALLFAIAALIAAVAFDFNVLDMGPVTLALAFINLVWFGYTTGMFILGIILRVGTRIQALAWGLVLVFQPLTGAFYPLEVMPPVLQAIARAFPPTYVFEAARAGLSSPVVHWDWFAFALLENLLYFAAATWFFQFMYRRSRQTGQFARNEE
jgi:ABC-2 type transport system permease protein